MRIVRSVLGRLRQTRHRVRQRFRIARVDVRHEVRAETFFGTPNAYSRDVGQAVTILMQFWFWPAR